MGELIRVGVLTLSDRCANKEMEDLSGPAIQAALPADQYTVILSAIIPDDEKLISRTLKRWCDDFPCDVILTTGGTGFAPRDFTPEATLKVIQRQADNIQQYILFSGLKKTPLAALSRGVAGIRGTTLIVNLPGSPTGALDGATALLKILPHAVDVLRHQDTSHSASS
jgi:molybdopterin adenylyltransferase